MPEEAKVNIIVKAKPSKLIYLLLIPAIAWVLSVLMFDIFAFYYIWLDGSICINEPNLTLLVSEFAMTIYAFLVVIVFGVYIIKIMEK